VENVFCASMADVFETNASMPLDDWREELHERLIQKTPCQNWQLLTKRPENIAPFYNGREIPFNVWLGTSVENQECAETRIPHLLKNDAPVRFLSCEPLLGPLDLRPWLSEINWVIVGGESGGRWREMNPDWVRSIRDQCQEFRCRSSLSNGRGSTLKNWVESWTAERGRNTRSRAPMAPFSMRLIK
jgi:protein gp37